MQQLKKVLLLQLLVSLPSSGLKEVVLSQLLLVRLKLVRFILNLMVVQEKLMIYLIQLKIDLMSDVQKLQKI